MGIPTESNQTTLNGAVPPIIESITMYPSCIHGKLGFYVEVKICKGSG